MERVVSSRPGAGAQRVDQVAGELVRHRLEPELLGDGGQRRARRRRRGRPGAAPRAPDAPRDRAERRFFFFFFVMVFGFCPRSASSTCRSCPSAISRRRRPDHIAVRRARRSGRGEHTTCSTSLFSCPSFTGPCQRVMLPLDSWLVSLLNRPIPPRSSEPMLQDQMPIPSELLDLCEDVPAFVLIGKVRPEREREGDPAILPAFEEAIFEGEPRRIALTDLCPLAIAGRIVSVANFVRVREAVRHRRERGRGHATVPP